MALTVFFSWQSDTPAEVGLDFIERALEQALAKLAIDATIQKAIRDEGLKVDRDTKGVPGTPPIVDTIFMKIDRAAIFVPDLTFAGKRLNGSPTPNPNVLVEYGWALKSLTYARILPVMNVAYGKPKADAMPFDMRHLRNPTAYNLRDRADAKTTQQELEHLANALADQIRTVLGSEEFKASMPKPPAPPPFPAVEPKDGLGRFRAKDAALAMSSDRPPFHVPKEVRLRDGPALWLRVMPSVNPGKHWLGTELKKKATGNPLLMPLAGHVDTGFGYMMADDGFGIYAVPGGEPIVAGSIVFAFETGEVWGIDAYSLGVTSSIPYVEREFVDALENYTGFLRDRLEIQPPYRWIAGMEGVKGRPLCLPTRKGYGWIQNPQGACLAEQIVEVGMHNKTTPAKVSLRPFFAKIYSRCGLERPDWMDNGN